MNADDTTTRPFEAHPRWCVVDEDFHEPEVATGHRGRTRTVTGHRDGPVSVRVCAAWWNPVPERRRPPYNSPESMRPVVQVAPLDGSEIDFTPAQARQFAAALLEAADELDPPAGGSVGG